MERIADTATLVYMTIADILRLMSVDAEAELDYRDEGMGRQRYAHLPLPGCTVADILPFKHLDIAMDRARYDALRASMTESMQTAPIAVNAGYLLNGGHRVAIALELGWTGMWTTSESELSEDREWNASHPSECFA